MTPESMIAIVTLICTTVSGMFGLWIRSSMSVNKSLKGVHDKLDCLYKRQRAHEEHTGFKSKSKKPTENGSDPLEDSGEWPR